MDASRLAPVRVGASKVANRMPPSSPAFGTPVHPIPAARPQEASKPSILPILLPPAALRPLAFRIFTKKHNINVTSSALEVLAIYVGKNCGSGWREEGLAERVLDETARQWKKNGGGVLVPGEEELKNILRQLGSTANQQSAEGAARLKHSKSFGQLLQRDSSTVTAAVEGLNVTESPGPCLTEWDAPADGDEPQDPRQWMKVVSTLDQPRLSYDFDRKHFQIAASPSSILPGPARKTSMFRQRYHLVQQRLLRNESFQTSAVKTLCRDLSNKMSPQTVQQAYKLTPIANLLGRGGTTHMLLGMLARSPSGHLILNDLTGSIILDLQFVWPSTEDWVWFTPGMIVVVDGQYEEGESKVGAELDGNNGVGGTIGGIFVAFGMTGPPSERRETTLGIGTSSLSGNAAIGAGFGWVDFLGVGSDRANGKAMRAVEGRVLRKGQQNAAGGGRSRIVFLGEVNLDATKTVLALRKVLATYAAEPADDTPMAVVLMGNFVRHGVMAGRGSEGSIEYKEYFDSLASALSDYPSMLHSTTFVFVPGDNDPWASSFSAGAATVVPRHAVPDLLTSRIRKVIATANADNERVTGKKSTGEAIWTTNPARLTIFGPCIELVLFRDDISGRLRRNAIRFAPTTDQPSMDTNGGADSDQAQNINGTDANDPAIDEAVPGSLDTKEQEPSATEIPPETRTARKLVKTIIDQGHLSPFPLNQRPVMWDFSGSLHLYPLPTALIMMDAEAPPFAIGLDGCHVMNPGPLTPPNKRGVAQWVEYSVKSRRGRLKEARY